MYQTKVTSSSNIHTPLQTISARKTVRAENGSWQLPVATYLKFKEPEGQLVRWLERLQEYTLNALRYVKHQHQNTDALSHYPSQITV